MFRRRSKPEKRQKSSPPPTPPGGEAAPASISISEALEKVATLQQAGKLQEAFDLCREIIKSDPENIEAYNTSGIIAFQGGHKQFALDQFRQAVALSPDHAGSHNNLGIILKETGQFDEAVAAFGRSLQLKPDDADTYFNLGNALHFLAKTEEAAEAYRRAVSLRPNFLDATYNQAKMLLKLERFAEAAEAFAQVVEIKPDFQEAHFELGKALYNSGQIEASNRAFEEVLRFDLKTDESNFWKTVATKHTRTPEELVAFCDARLSDAPGDPVALSTKAIALHEIGDDKAARELIDFDRFIRPVRLSAPEGFDSVKTFNAALTDHVRNHPSMSYERSGHATRNGQHSGDLNVEPRGPIAQLEAAIIGAAKDYVSQIPPAPHPFVDNIPARSRQIIWAIIMQSQGHQVAHIHPHAWLSGVYYVQLPGIIDEPDSDKAGWIEFGKPPDDFGAVRDPEVKLFKPEEGLMFLFPSYFYHRTIPFESDEERVSIAFDLIPAG